jgi:hypothetical protein
MIISSDGDDPAKRTVAVVVSVLGRRFFCGFPSSSENETKTRT